MKKEPRIRHIGVIPPHPVRCKKYLADFTSVVAPSFRIIPRTRFYRISFARLYEVERGGSGYDVVLAGRMKDESEPEINNVFSAILAARNAFRLSTIFILSFNQLLARLLGLDPRAEKLYLERTLMLDEKPAEHPGGIICTSSTDPAFLVSIIADVLDGPAGYLNLKRVHHIETQAHFLNHPPGHTQLGIG